MLVSSYSTCFRNSNPQSFYEVNWEATRMCCKLVGLRSQALDPRVTNRDIIRRIPGVKYLPPEENRHTLFISA